MNTLFLDACAGSAQFVKCGCEIANATNAQDVEIAKAICCSIVALAGIIVGGFLIWKLMDHVAKGLAGFYRRRCEVEDIRRKQSAEEKKQKTDLINKKLEILHEYCYETETVEKDSKERKKLKNHNVEKDAIDEYIKTLDSEITSKNISKDSECNG
jgi:hypothetical protein